MLPVGLVCFRSCFFYCHNPTNCLFPSLARDALPAQFRYYSTPTCDAFRGAVGLNTLLFPSLLSCAIIAYEHTQMAQAALERAQEEEDGRVANVPESLCLLSAER